MVLNMKFQICGLEFQNGADLPPDNTPLPTNLQIQEVSAEVLWRVTQSPGLH